MLCGCRLPRWNKDRLHLGNSHRAAASGAAVPFASAAVEWLVGAAGAGVFGLVLGGVIVAALHFMPRRTAAAH